MADDKQIDFVDGVTPVMARWLDTMQEWQQGGAWNLKVQISGMSVVVPAGVLENTVGLIIKGKMRYITSPVSVNLSGLTNGTVSVYAVAQDNDDTPSFYLEAYNNPTTPTATYYRKIAEVTKGTSSVTNLVVPSSLITTTESIQDGAVTAPKINNALKPSAGAATGTEALRALGTGANHAFQGSAGVALQNWFSSSTYPVPLYTYGPLTNPIVINGGWNVDTVFLYGAQGPSPVQGKTWRLRLFVCGHWFGNGNVGNLTIRLASDPVAGTGIVHQAGTSFGSGSEIWTITTSYTTNVDRQLLQFGHLANMAGGGGGAQLHIQGIIIEGYLA